MTVLTFETDALVAALREARGAVQRRNTIPILSNVMIEADPSGTVRLSTTDLDVLVTRQLLGKVDAPVAFTLDANRLADVVGTFVPGSQTTIRYEPPAATVSSGRARLRFATLPATDFPLIPQGDVSARFTVDAKALTRAIGAVRHAVSSEETRYYLNGVFVHARAGQLVYVATDGHRLARYVDALPAGAEQMPDVILRTRCIDLVRAAAEARNVPVEIAVSPTKVTMTAGDFTLVAKTVDATYPDYTRVIPSGQQLLLGVDRDAFRETLNRVSVAVSDKVRAVKVELASDLLRASVTSAEHGAAVDELPCAYASAPLEIGFNSRYLRDALAVFDVDEVELAMSGPRDPVLMTSTKASGVTLVLMPMNA